MDYLKRGLYKIIRENLKKEIIRENLKKEITGNLGPVIEEDDRLICYIDKKKCKKRNHGYTIACSGVRNKELAKVYNLNKPICYVIDGLRFHKTNVYIFEYDGCDVVIKNCHFDYELYIKTAGKCTIENTEIQSLILLSVYAKELVIKNMNISNYYFYPNFRISLGANERLDIINSNIGEEKKKTNVSVTSENELNLVSSKISGSVVECRSPEIVTDSSSSLTADSTVKLETIDFDKINISSPTIIYNGDEVSSSKQEIILEKITDPLKLKRLEVINFLKKIQEECIRENERNLIDYQESLNNRPISKVLKRDIKSNK